MDQEALRIWVLLAQPQPSHRVPGSMSAGLRHVPVQFAMWQATIGHQLRCQAKNPSLATPPFHPILRLPPRSGVLDGVSRRAAVRIDPAHQLSAVLRAEYIGFGRDGYQLPPGRRRDPPLNRPARQRQQAVFPQHRRAHDMSLRSHEPSLFPHIGFPADNDRFATPGTGGLIPIGAHLAALSLCPGARMDKPPLAASIPATP